MKQSTMKVAGGLLMAVTTALLAGPAAAFDFGGYLRAGPGSSNEDAARACYGLAGPGLKYRLGNECDFYGEFGFGHDAKVGNVDYRAYLMANTYNTGSDVGPANAKFNQMYVQGKGFDFSPGTNFWIGKRFYGRADVHIVDTFFTLLDGVGAGADGIDLGAAKLGVAFFRTDGGATQPGSRLNVDVSEIAVNPGGKIRVLGALTNGTFTGGTSGSSLTLQHNQENFLGLGGGNTLWLQFSRGSAGLDGNFGDLTAGSDVKGYRLAESLTWQKGPFGGQALAMWQQDTAASGLKTVSTSIGGRVSYGVSNNFKLVAELGRSAKTPEGAPTQELTKFTFAPTLSTGSGFWNRPELRLYVTTARWNAAANSAAGVGGLTGIGNGKTQGTSFGAQVEAWF